jgi:murein DD-endopeptidase MepM/ murein hydrolase activator NlpD
MSRIAPGLRKGAKINQGQVIGYVGSTGWSTGAHLHYEFRVAGVAKDPNQYKSLAQQPLNQAELARFRMAAAEMNHRFSLLGPSGSAMAAR